MGCRPPVVEFYFGAGSRYSYLAAAWLPGIAAETGARFDWLPVDSVRLIRARGHDPFAAPGGVGQYDWGLPAAGRGDLGRALRRALP